MPYLYETHLHTNVGSRCGISAPEEYIRAYKDFGYTGIIVTDHFFNGNCAIDPNLPWRDRINAFTRGYERAKAEGDKQDLDVFFGFEARLGNDECLIYGLDKAWLYEHPEIMACDHARMLALVHAGGGAIVQAHPYRERTYMDAVDIYPGDVDAFEGYNLTNSRGEDRRACELARRKGIPLTAGSDVHDVRKLASGGPFGVATDTRWGSIQDYVRILRSKGKMSLSLVLPGEENRSENFTLNFAVHIHETQGAPYAVRTL